LLLFLSFFFWMMSGQQLRGAFTTTVAGEVSNGEGGATGALCTGYTLVVYYCKRHCFFIFPIAYTTCTDGCLTSSSYLSYHFNNVNLCFHMSNQILEYNSNLKSFESFLCQILVLFIEYVIDFIFLHYVII